MIPRNVVTYFPAERSVTHTRDAQIAVGFSGPNDQVPSRLAWLSIDEAKQLVERINAELAVHERILLGPGTSA